MEITFEREYQKLQRRIAQVQARQGFEGCYMELIRQAKQSSGFIRNHSYMFDDPKMRLHEISKQLKRLPQNQNWNLVDTRINKIRELTKVK